MFKRSDIKPEIFVLRWEVSRMECQEKRALASNNLPVSRFFLGLVQLASLTINHLRCQPLVSQGGASQKKDAWCNKKHRMVWSKRQHLRREGADVALLQELALILTHR